MVTLVLGDSQLMAKAEAMFSTGEISQKRMARSEFLTPLLDKYPDSPYAERAQNMLDDLESEEYERQLKNKMRLGKEPSSESERLVIRAWDCERLGDRLTAVENYEAVI